MQMPVRSLRPFAFAALLAASFLIAPLAARPAAAIEVQRVVSPGGIEAWLVEDHSNPILALSFSVLGGAAADPAGLEGRARMAAALLDEGAGPYDSQAFRQALEKDSITLSFSAGDDELSGTLIALTEDRARAAELLELALTEPRFDEEPVERIRAQLQVSIARKANDPQSLAYRALDELVFEGHPYGRPAEGTVESVGAIARADLASYAAERLARDTLMIGVVGDITPEELGALLDQVFGSLPAESPPLDIPEVQPPAAGKLAVIELPVPQSVVFLAQPGPKRDDPDFYAAQVVNHVLGGGTFSSRLYQEVREERGLAYSVWSDLAARDRGGLWLAGVATQNARVAESIALIEQIWGELAAEGPTDAEIEKAITYLTGSFALRLTSSEDIAQILVSMQREELGIDYIAAREGFYQDLTPDDVRRVARAWLDPGRLAVVVAGQPEGLAAAPAEAPAEEPVAN